MKSFAILLFCASLSACASPQARVETATAVAASKPVAAVTCLPMATYPLAQERALAAAVAALPPDSPLVQAVIDYGALRKANRACLAQQSR